MRHASLFSGIGGFDLAAEEVGWSNVFNCELNPICRRVLNYHFPNAEGYEDITKTDFRKWQGRVDVLSGGFPCQPFSVAGQRKGNEDHRYLWPEMLRAIEECKPTWVIGENVVGILSMVQSSKTAEVEVQTDLFGETYTYEEKKEKFILAQIIEDLEDREYSVQAFVIPACSLGAPHRRDRIWIVAHYANERVEGTRQRKGNETNPTPVATNTDSNGRVQGGTKGTRAHQDETQRIKVQLNTKRSSKESVAANTNSDGCKREYYEKSEERQSNRRNSEDISARREQRGWGNFPTKSPICGRNDGIPRRLDGITFSRWRAEAIKAYGNAIVPEVARVIFESIDKVEKEKEDVSR